MLGKVPILLFPMLIHNINTMKRGILENTKFVVMLISLAVISACNNKQTVNNSNENEIIQQLKTVKGKGILFGHQDDLAYGVEWKYVDGESDVKQVTGDYPAMFGWELGGLEMGWKKSLDSVPFDSIRYFVAKAYAMGGINTISWHPYSLINGNNSWDNEVEVVEHILEGGKLHEEFKAQLTLVGNFLLSLKTTEGKAIPFIFRPWHEMDGEWFWWGSKTTTPEELIALFRLTITHLQEMGLTEMLVAYSPDRNFTTTEEYYTWYPGDDIIDVLGVDNYWDVAQPGGYLTAIEKLHIVINAAKEKEMISAFTESGCYQVEDTLWYPEKYGKVFEDSLIQAELSYAHVWRNEKTAGYYFPHNGHPSAAGAAELLAKPYMFLLNDFNKAKEE